MKLLTAHCWNVWWCIFVCFVVKVFSCLQGFFWVTFEPNVWLLLQHYCCHIHKSFSTTVQKNLLQISVKEKAEYPLHLVSSVLLKSWWNCPWLPDSVCRCSGLQSCRGFLQSAHESGAQIIACHRGKTFTAKIISRYLQSSTFLLSN